VDIQSIKNRFGIIGNSQGLNFALQVAAQVSNTDLTVLIAGESGVGKEAFSVTKKGPLPVQLTPAKAISKQ
jgi:transcriptional regulator with GAF, ATPase, and Fis domain